MSAQAVGGLESRALVRICEAVTGFRGVNRLAAHGTYSATTGKAGDRRAPRRVSADRRSTVCRSLSETEPIEAHSAGIFITDERGLPGTVAMILHPHI
jgi:hypothetical protein